MPEDGIRVAPDTVAYADREKLVVEFAIPGAPTETIDVKAEVQKCVVAANRRG